MKTCKDCNTEKPYSDFVPKASCKDGYEIRCRECRAIKYSKADPFKVFRKLYHSQCTHSVDRGHPHPAYTLNQLIEWADEQPNLISIWEAYVASGYKTDLRPSVDRKNDSLPYTLCNIQLMTWQENRRKGAASKKEGTLNARQRPVIALHLDGRFYKHYVSTIAAARDVSGYTWGIITVADGKPVKQSNGRYYQPKTYKGYLWQWA